jgi:hypothetical protein
VLLTLRRTDGSGYLGPLHIAIGIEALLLESPRTHLINTRPTVDSVLPGSMDLPTGPKGRLFSVGRNVLFTLAPIYEIASRQFDK